MSEPGDVSEDVSDGGRVKDRLEEFRKHRERMNAKILGSEHLGIKRFFALDTQAYADGALPGKTKELLGLTASAVLRCNDCIGQIGLRQNQRIADNGTIHGGGVFAG